MNGSLSDAAWTEGNEGLPQQTFLGASIRSFSLNAGFGDTASTLSVELVNDEYNISDLTELGSGDDKEGGEDPSEAIATKDPEPALELLGTKDTEDQLKDPGGEEDFFNLFKGAALGAGKSFSAPRGQDFMYRLDFAPPEPLEVSITDEDYLAKLEQMSSSEMLDDIIKRNSGNSGGMLT